MLKVLLYLNTLIYLFEDELNEYNVLIDQTLKKYFKMKKMGIPLQAIKNKMALVGISEKYIQYIEFKESTTFLEANNSINNKMKNNTTKNKYENKLENQLGSHFNIKSINKKITKDNNNNKPISILNKINPNDLLGVKLKKINNESNKSSSSNKKATSDIRVPSLHQIKTAIHNLKKIKFYNIKFYFLFLFLFFYFYF